MFLGCDCGGHIYVESANSHLSGSGVPKVITCPKLNVSIEIAGVGAASPCLIVHKGLGDPSPEVLENLVPNAVAPTFGT